jgi:hypothetical protein
MVSTPHAASCLRETSPAAACSRESSPDAACSRELSGKGTVERSEEWAEQCGREETRGAGTNEFSVPCRGGDP